jgi:hypothetical protein
MNIRSNSGRLRIEEDQLLLLKAAQHFGMHGLASHDKRQREIYRTVKTLNYLTEQLKGDGFDISQISLYLHHLPKCRSSLKGKRYVSTVPVKLIRAQNDMQANHMDEVFCTTITRYLQELSSVLGMNDVCLISQV